SVTALEFCRRHYAAAVLTAALALAPAQVLMVGAVVFGAAALGGSGGVAELRAQEVSEKQRSLRENLPPEEQPVRSRELTREALRGGSGTHWAPGDLMRGILPRAWSVLAFVAVLLAGVFLAQAALVPLL